MSRLKGKYRDNDDKGYPALRASAGESPSKRIEAPAYLDNTDSSSTAETEYGL
jgi:hypothetical protein